MLIGCLEISDTIFETIIDNPIMKAIILACVVALAAANLFLEQDPIIEHVNNLKTTWKAGHNHYFDGKTIEEIKYLMGTLETPEHLKLPLK